MRLLSKIAVVLDALAFARNLVRSQGALAAENFFLRKQLTFFIEREQTPRRTDNSTRFTMVTLAKLFEWRNALIVVKPDTLIRWHRKGFRLFWRWKSRPKGRPPVPEELKKLIVKRAIANVSYVKFANMWTWAGHARSCGSLPPRASHKFSQRSMGWLQLKPRTESSAQHWNGLSNTRRETTLRSGRRRNRTPPVPVPTVTDSGASGTTSSSGSWTYEPRKLM